MAIWSRFFGNAASTAAGYGIGSAVTPVLRPRVQELANHEWEAHRTMPLSPADAAEATIRGAMGVEDAAAEAGQTGINPSRFAVLRALAGDAPGVEEALAAWNRGLIDE